MPAVGKIVRGAGQVALAAGAAIAVCTISILALAFTLACAAPLKALRA